MTNAINFERDIFISYAHIDNQPLNPDDKGWVSLFDYALKNRLAQILGREADVWRDRKLKGIDVLDDEILSQFPNLKVFISILSPRYFNSDYCKLELKEFLEAAQHSGGLHIGTKSRVVPVVKTPVDMDLLQKEFKGALGYNFFAEDDSGRFREFGWDGESESITKLKRKIDDVAQDVSKLIELMENGVSQDEDSLQDMANTDPNKTVYLARATSDMERERENILRDLKTQGYTVLPNKLLPRDATFNEHVNGYLGRCKLAIHLIGEKYGWIPEDEERSIVELQFSLSQEASLNRLVWLPGERSRIEDQRLKNFVDALNDDAISQPNTELITDNLESFKTMIIDSLKELETVEDGDGQTNLEETVSRVYLVYDESDSKYAAAIDDYLYNQGIEVLRPTFVGHEHEQRTFHQDNLKVCDGVLVFCHSAGESWLNFRVNDLRKAPGFRNGKPLNVGGVYLCGDRSEFKDRYRSREVLVIKQFEQSGCGDLDPFLNRLKEGEGEN